jgi:hypothetical protein
MKTSIKYLINGSKLTIPCVLFALIMAGCAGLSHHSDPLAGWKYMYLGQLDQAIVQDYEAFIETLPPDERIQLDKYSIGPYEDENGNHAVKFEIGKSGIFHGTFWDYVLFYNKDNKRIKVVKYAAGKYAEW